MIGFGRKEQMVFPCRCFPSSFFEEEEEIEYETRTQTKSTSYYTASSDLNRSLPDSQAKASLFSNLARKQSNLRVFTFPELKAATKNFCRDSIIGEGGLGFVYMGVIKSLEFPFDEIQVAVKYASRALQGPKGWLIELHLLGGIKHQNLVKLIGYCAEENENENERGIQRLLVYGYMPNRSVLDHLSTSSETPLPWITRLKVAQDVACGLAYLHEQMIIIRDFKSSNVLLDNQWHAKLSDVGLARLGPQEGLTPLLTEVTGTMGYAAPEYIQTGHHTSKSDVWSYGVFLYELITGRHPLDRNRPENEKKLLEWVKPHLDSKNFRVIIDPRLEDNYSPESAQKLSFIADKCLCKNPESRPTMSEVLVMFNQLAGVPSHATKVAAPPKSLVRVAAIKLKKVFMCTTTTTTKV